MTTQSDLLKQAHELIDCVESWSDFHKKKADYCRCVWCTWLRDYEAAMREPTKPFHAPTCLSTVYGAGVTCTCGVGKDAPSPATEQGPTDTEIVDYLQANVDRAKQAGFVTMTLGIGDKTIRELVGVAVMQSKKQEP